MADQGPAQRRGVLSPPEPVHLDGEENLIIPPNTRPIAIPVSRVPDIRAMVMAEVENQITERLLKIEKALIDGVGRRMEGIEADNANLRTNLFEGVGQEREHSVVIENLPAKITKLTERLDEVRKDLDKAVVRPSDQGRVVKEDLPEEIERLRKDLNSLRSEEIKSLRTRLEDELAKQKDITNKLKNDLISQWHTKSEEEKKELGRQLHIAMQKYKLEVTNKELDNFWFPLPANTYGTAIWALIVSDNKSFSVGGLKRLMSFKGMEGEDEEMPPAQQWSEDHPWFMRPYLWWRKRLWPFLNVAFFLLIGVGLCMATFLIQFGFAYLLNTSLELDPTFRSTDGTEYICGTTGWLQFISIGFYLAYMLGQLPKVLKTFLLIWFADYETTCERGVELKKKLYSGTKEEKEQIKQLKSELEEFKWPWCTRSRTELLVRRLLATIVCGLDLTVTCFVTYVGVRYIFWSGYKSLDPGYLDPADADPDRFGPWPAESGGFPWMSNTSGVEEVLMASLALVFIMDIDENLFEYMLPVCIQNIVLDTRLSCTKWMPSAFAEEDFEDLGQPAMRKGEEEARGTRAEGEDNLTEKQRMRKDREKRMEEHRATWMQLIPFVTFFWTAIVITLAAGVVWFVRASSECARFTPVEMPTMPAATEVDDGVWLLNNDHSDGAYVIFIPVFVISGCCLLGVLYYCTCVYCVGPVRVKDEDLLPKWNQEENPEDKVKGSHAQGVLLDQKTDPDGRKGNLEADHTESERELVANVERAAGVR